MARPSRNTGTGDIVHILVFLLGIAIILVAAETATAAALFLAIGVFCAILVAFAFIAAHLRADLSFFLLIPTVMSAFQNMYLSPFAEAIPRAALQVVIVVNFLYSVLIYFALLLAHPKGKNDPATRAARTITVLLTVMLVYGAGMMIAEGNNLGAGIASARNLSAPFLFFLIGYYAAAHTALRRYLRYVVVLGWVALIAAAVEYFVPDFWPTIGLHHLWELKGIDVTVNSLLPKNFYASEQVVPGEFIRRMAGPFADPVNFGTFLFAIIVVAWFMRSRLLVFMSLVATALTVSKGAVLGLLAFTTVWAKKFRSGFEFTLLALFTAGAALYVYAFTQTSSTGSTTAHINGLLAALVELPQHPAGRGFGGTGVLAGLLSDEATEGGSAIVESGFGMVLGQLGIVGLIVYFGFFATVFRAVSRVRETRTYVLGMALVLAIALNAAFNEVALSPNSCAIYFIVLGLIIGSRSDDAEAPPRPAQQLQVGAAGQVQYPRASPDPTNTMTAQSAAGVDP